MSVNIEELMGYYGEPISNVCQNVSTREPYRHQDDTSSAFYPIFKGQMYYALIINIKRVNHVEQKTDKYQERSVRT